VGMEELRDCPGWTAYDARRRARAGKVNYQSQSHTEPYHSHIEPYQSHTEPYQVHTEPYQFLYPVPFTVEHRL